MTLEEFLDLFDRLVADIGREWTLEDGMALRCDAHCPLTFTALFGPHESPDEALIDDATDWQLSARVLEIDEHTAEHIVVAADKTMDLLSVRQRRLDQALLARIRERLLAACEPTAQDE